KRQNISENDKVIHKYRCNHCPGYHLFEIHQLNLIFAKVEILRVLILYTELAEYVTANIREFVSTNPQTEFLVVHYPVNAEAPFKFNEESHIQFIIYQQDSWSKTSEMCKNFSPDVVLCSGWSNRDYIAWISTYNKPCAKVLCFDNVWKNTF